MTDWRETQCGKVVLRGALEGGEAKVQMISSMTQEVSCGGMYIPGWQLNFLPPLPPREPRVHVIHLMTDAQAPSLLLINAKSNPAAAAPTEDSPPAIEQTQVGSEAMVQGLGQWWNKN